jgi:hypothetical protein
VNHVKQQDERLLGVKRKTISGMSTHNSRGQTICCTDSATDRKWLLTAYYGFIARHPEISRQPKSNLYGRGSTVLQRMRIFPHHGEIYGLKSFKRYLEISYGLICHFHYARTSKIFAL